MRFQSYDLNEIDTSLVLNKLQENRHAYQVQDLDGVQIHTGTAKDKNYLIVVSSTTGNAILFNMP